MAWWNLAANGCSGDPRSVVRHGGHFCEGEHLLGYGGQRGARAPAEGGACRPASSYEQPAMRPPGVWTSDVGSASRGASVRPQSLAAAMIAFPPPTAQVHVHALPDENENSPQRKVRDRGNKHQEHITQSYS